MANISGLSKYPPEVQDRFRAQLAFIQERRSKMPTLVRKVADAHKCSLGNVYTVLSGHTFNAEIIRIAYALMVSELGLGTLSTNTNVRYKDLKGHDFLQLMREAQADTIQAEVNARIGLQMLDATRRRYGTTIGTLESYYKFNFEQIPDELATIIQTELAEARHPDSFILNTSVVPNGTPSDTDIAAFQMMVASGVISEDGRPILSGQVDPEEDQEVDPADPDPMAAGNHYNKAGILLYTLGES